MPGARWIVAALAVAVAGPARPPAPQQMPTQTGQAAFAAIAEIVSILEADSTTDWSRVNITALRDHLVDMDRVTMDAQVSQRSIDGGVEMTVTGSAPVMASARRMIQAHAGMTNGVQGRTVAVRDLRDSLVVSWTTSRAADVVRLRALGFFGFLAQGSHHQMHHLMIARGMDPHRSMR